MNKGQTDQRISGWGSIACMLLVIASTALAIKPDEMEPNKWYDLISFGYNLHDIQCDPVVPGRIFAVAMIPFYCEPVISLDYGKSWKSIVGNLPTLDSLYPESVSLSVVFPNEIDRIIYCIITNNYPANSIYCSVDLGQTWIRSGDFAHSIADACKAHPTQGYLLAPETVDNQAYRGVKNSREENSQYIKKSLDGGKTWHYTAEYNDAGTVNKFYFNPLQPDCAYATTEIYGGYFVLKSTDSGENWQSIQSGSGWGGRGVYNLVFHPTDSNTIVAIHDPREGMYYSLKITTDGGVSWQNFGPPKCEAWSFYFLPENPSIMFIVSGDCRNNIYKSTDNGLNWVVKWTYSPVYEIRQYLNFFQMPWGGNELYCNISGLIHSSDLGEQWWPTYPVDEASPSRAGWINPDDNSFMLLEQLGVGSFFSSDSGTSWHVISENPNSGTTGSLKRSYINPSVIYSVFSKDYCDGVSNVVIRKSENMGKTWIELPWNSELSLKRIFVSRSLPNRIFSVATEAPYYNDHLRVTDDDGQTWRDVEIPDNKNIYSIFDDPELPDKWYMLGEMSNEYKARVYISADAGQSWIKKGEETGFSPVNFYQSIGGSLEMHPSDHNLIYAFLDGIFYSVDRGEHWNRDSGLNGCSGVMYLDSTDKTTLYANWNRNQGGLARTTDRGVCWSETEFPPEIYLSSNSSVIYDLDRMRAMKIQTVAPQIDLMGFGNTQLGSDSSGMLSLLVQTSDPDSNDQVIGVDLYYDNAPLNYRMTDELIPGSGFFFSEWSVTNPPSGQYHLTLRAVDRFGLQSDPSFLVVKPSHP